MTRDQRKQLNKIKKIIDQYLKGYVGEPVNNIEPIIRKMWEERLKPLLVKQGKFKVKVKKHPTLSDTLNVTVLLWPTKLLEIPYEEVNEDEDR